MAVMIDKETKEAVPVTAFLKGDQLAKDIAKVNDAARGKFLTVFGMALCLMKNYDPFQSPTHFKMMDLLKKFDKNFNATGKNYGKVGPDRTIDDVMKRRQDRWNFLFIAGMWFQDLFNYDFRRTEQCIIPYATQEGEISFCAYNTGVGWRNIIEKMHMTATLTKWYEEHGRHEIFAGGKKVQMEEVEHSLNLRDGIVTNEVQHDLDKLGIAKTAREEKTRARNEKMKTDGATRREDGSSVSRSCSERKAGGCGKWFPAVDGACSGEEVGGSWGAGGRGLVVLGSQFSVLGLWKAALDGRLFLLGKIGFTTGVTELRRAFSLVWSSSAATGSCGGTVDRWSSRLHLHQARFIHSNQANLSEDIRSEIAPSPWIR